MKFRFVDPQRASHAGQNFRLAVDRLVSRLRIGDQHVGRPARDVFFAAQMKRERHRHLGHQVMVALAIFMELFHASLPVADAFPLSSIALARFFFLLLPPTFL